MKLYNSVGPNPHVVRMFLAEKNVEIPIQKIDVRGGENRREPYISQVNPRGQCPALELDDGSHLTEITAICEYLEEKFPSPALIGSTPEERGVTRMWTRRLDLSIGEPMAKGEGGWPVPASLGAAPIHPAPGLVVIGAVSADEGFRGVDRNFARWFGRGRHAGRRYACQC